jgi:hypothetical protein
MRIQSGSRVFMIKNWKKFTAEIFFQFTYPYASIKDVQATGEAFSPQKRTSSTSKHKISKIYHFCGSFLPSWIRIRIRNTAAKGQIFRQREIHSRRTKLPELNAPQIDVKSRSNGFDITLLEGPQPARPGDHDSLPQFILI